MNILTKEAILAADDLPRETVLMPEWGGDVYVRTMSGTDRDAFESSLIARDGAKGMAVWKTFAPDLLRSPCAMRWEVVFLKVAKLLRLAEKVLVH